MCVKEFQIGMLFATVLHDFQQITRVHLICRLINGACLRFSTQFALGALIAQAYQGGRNGVLIN